MTFTVLALTLAFQTPINSTLDPNEVEYQNVLNTLATSQTMSWELVGNIIYRGKTTQLVSYITWSSSNVSNGAGGTKPQLQAEIEDNVNGVLTKRIVADGNTVWSYDLTTHEYSATSYGGDGPTRSEFYQRDLLSNLNLLASGQTSYLTKLVRQVYNIPQPYSSWMPGVVSVNEGIGPFVDPINSTMSYPPTSTGLAYNYYLYNGSPKRSIVFEVLPGQNSGTSSTPDQLTAIYFNQIDQLGRNQRLTTWKMMPTPSPNITASLFLPYTGTQTAGWKAVVAPRATTN